MGETIPMFAEVEEAKRKQKRKKKFPRCDFDFDFEAKEWIGITVDQVKEWETTFPLVDVVNELTRKMPVWLQGNPDKANRYKKWGRFIVNWLSWQQERYEQFRR